MSERIVSQYVEAIYRVFVRTSENVDRRIDEILSKIILAYPTLGEPEIVEVTWPVEPSRVNELSDRGFLILNNGHGVYEVVIKEITIKILGGTDDTVRALREKFGNVWAVLRVVKEELGGFQAL